MPYITHVGRVMVPVADQDAAIAFYTDRLGFDLVADVPFADGERWVEVAPAGGGAALALVPADNRFPAGRMTGVALGSLDPRADHAELAGRGVDVDVDMMGGTGGVPLMFVFRDGDGNHLMVVANSPPA